MRTRIGPDLLEVPDDEPAGPPCTVCGAEMERIACNTCGGEGGRDSDALMEEDPLWYDGVEWERCEDCQGEGYYWLCWNAPHKDAA
jgi:DnaJ-class molecular chaperone